MAPGALEQLLRGLAPRGSSDLEQRVIAGRARNEDAVVVRMPAGKAIVQTVDILAPIVNDAFWFGRIAACNALSDVYALGGQPWCAMNVAFFPTCLTENDPENILANILRGGMDALEEAGAVLAGGHTVQDDELKYGMAVTGVIDPEHVAANDKLRPGLRLLLTKPLGTGILATGVKARWDDHEESEALLQRWCGRLNRIPGEAITHFRIPAATDITGFEWGVMPSPVGSVSGSAILGGSGLAVPENSANKDLALSFIKWFYEEENFSYYLDLDKGLSSLTGVTYQPADEKAAADYTVLQAEVGQTTTLFSVDESSMWRNYLDNEYRDALKQAVNGDMTAEEALNDFAAALAEKSGWAQ
mgnify:CR=1 FL=1